MIDIEDINPGKSYACKFRVKTMLDEHGHPAPNLTDTPLKGVGDYEGLGVLMQRDTEQRLVKLKDQKSSKEFVIAYEDIWDVDVVDWIEPLVISN
tara:strand:+ start:2037 stop:2321 length:285 start_codon:yes stop_codon:yes gene_type:complete